VLISIRYTPQLSTEYASRTIVAHVGSTVKPRLFQTTRHIYPELEACIHDVLVEQSLVHEARLEKELVGPDRHAAALHALDLELGVFVRHGSQ
jgi:hypothetical protein